MCFSEGKNRRSHLPCFTLVGSLANIFTLVYPMLIISHGSRLPGAGGWKPE